MRQRLKPLPWLAVVLLLAAPPCCWAGHPGSQSRVAAHCVGCTPDDCDNFGLDPLPLPKAPSPEAQQAQFESYATGAFPVARGQAWSFRGKTYSAAGVADNAGFREAAMSRARRRILAAAPSAQRPGETNPTHIASNR